jgi:hypothetical protein
MHPVLAYSRITGDQKQRVAMVCEKPKIWNGAQDIGRPSEMGLHDAEISVHRQRQITFPSNTVVAKARAAGFPILLVVAIVLLVLLGTSALGPLVSRRRIWWMEPHEHSKSRSRQPVSQLRIGARSAGRVATS